jgi:ribosome-associated protein
MANMLSIEGGIEIPHDEFQFSYARSGGPGGQNVNKVNSKAILHWPVSVSASLPDDVRARFVEQFGSRITVDGMLVISSQVFRDQRRNSEECLRRLKEMLDQVAVPPVPRVATAPSRSAKERRVDAKSKHSQKKEQRRWRGDY